MDLAGAIALWREAGSWAAMRAQLRSVTTSKVDEIAPAPTVE
jgi:hypothetical protein